MSNPKQDVCCGAIVLYGKQRFLVIAVRGGHCLIGPITVQRVPRHRADVILSGYPDACDEIVRCGDALSVPQWLLTDTEVKVSKRGMRQVISGASAEFAARRVELLRPGAYRCALARGYRPGDKGRKIGGAPHAE
ncbi:hypothetical protein AD952_14125 [Acetobacter cerevisiae]|uniref:Uncharacterized protein n=1 Tax=Acetobacter cerevisiae TaxID=178900 RepID=A0A149UPE8_9PROT|nr:hypothetical protein [Acetobacter cerevisiae]KXV69792.1 hypothetical protein AD952_14125 [Acetobacter cerevisiae]